MGCGGKVATSVYPCGTPRRIGGQILCDKCKKEELKKDEDFISQLSVELCLAMPKVRHSQ